MFVRLTISAPTSAAVRPWTRKPSTSRPALQSRKALMTHNPRPSDNTTNGSVNNTSTGFRKALNSPSKTATSNSVSPSV